MADSIINWDDPATADVALIGVGYDLTSSFGKGAKYGPEAILACLRTQVEIYEPTSGLSPASHLRIGFDDLGDLNSLEPTLMVHRVRSVADAYFSSSSTLPIFVGGEHSISNGPFLSIAEMRGTSDVTIVSIDAHLDLRDTDADYEEMPYGKYAHSCVMRRAVELSFPVVWVGARAFSLEEVDFLVEKDLPCFQWGFGNKPSIEMILQSITTSKVYLSLDVDGIDPAHMPATGVPVQGGLEWWYMLRLIREIFRAKEVIGADLMEVAPRPGDSLTEYGAAQILYTMIAYALESGNFKGRA